MYERDIGIKRERHTLGIAKATHGERCVCRARENVNRINIDGCWSYLCDDCMQTLWMLHLGEDISGRTLNRDEYLADIGIKR